MLFFINGLLGCATNSNRQCVSSLNKERTDYHKNTVKQNPTLSNIIKEDKNPLSRFSGIQYAELDGPSLKIKFINRATCKTAEIGLFYG